MASFASYSLAKRHADVLVKDLAKGSQVTALHPVQASDALAALERLADFYRNTGRRVSLLAGISEFVEASTKLNGRTLGEAVEGYLRNIATVKRRDVTAAVEEFIQTNEPRTRATNGQRAQLSGKYFYNLAIQLRRFAATFPNTAFCDLSKEHMDTPVVLMLSPALPRFWESDCPVVLTCEPFPEAVCIEISPCRLLPPPCDQLRESSEIMRLRKWLVTHTGTLPRILDGTTQKTHQGIKLPPLGEKFDDNPQFLDACAKVRYKAGFADKDRTVGILRRVEKGKPGGKRATRFRYNFLSSGVR